MVVQLAEFRRSPSEAAVRAFKDAETELVLAALAWRSIHTDGTHMRLVRAVDALVEAAERE